MDAMRGFRVFLGKEIREQVRTSRFLVVAIIFVLFGLMSPLLAKYTPQILERFAPEVEIMMPTPTAGDAIDQLQSNLGQTGPIVAILLAMGAVARERERGTAAFVLTKPVTRSAFLAAKFLALALTITVSVLLAGAAAYFYTTVLFEALPVGGFLAAILLLDLAILTYAAATFLASTVVGSALPAAGAGIAVFVLTAIVSAVPRIGAYMPMGLFGPGRALALGEPPAALAGPLAVNLGAVAVLLVVAWLVFRRQEIGS